MWFIVASLLEYLVSVADLLLLQGKVSLLEYLFRVADLTLLLLSKISLTEHLSIVVSVSVSV